MGCYAVSVGILTDVSEGRNDPIFRDNQWLGTVDMGRSEGN